MKVIYRLKLGQDEFELQAEVKDEKDFFETMSFYSNLPKAAPNGATDLKLVFRTTKKGHKYYSLVSETEKMEFKLGQNLEANGGGLFCKGWEPLYQGENQDDQQEGQSAAPIGAAPIKAQAVVQKAQPAKAQAAPIQAPTPAAMPAPQTITPTPAAAPVQSAPATPAANPNVTATANNVLARFGINK